MPRKVATAVIPRRTVFSSDQLPKDLSERRRRNLWRDIYRALYGPLDVQYAGDGPFSVRFESIQWGSLRLVRCQSTVERFVRTRRCVAVAGSDNFHLALNLGRVPMSVRQVHREASFEPGALALLSDAEPGEFVPGASRQWLFVSVPRQRLLERVREADDLVARPVHSRHAAVRHLRRYLALVLAPDGIDEDVLLNALVESTLVDLIALALSASRESAEFAHQRGLRAARLQMTVGAIASGYTDPGFSVHAVASQLGLSPRYVQDLLHDTGTSLTERVRERRLQKARAMLTDRSFDGCTVLDVALESGFSDVSYFNRAFRRRFGMAPSDMRHGLFRFVRGES
ncbi:MAG: AraC family transcriptional regulator [Vicinamibacterales bacterium]